MNKLFVTQPFLPTLDEFIPSLKQIWDNKWLTNNGPFHQQFEDQLAKFLNVPYVSLFSNATIALMVALKSLDIKGEVITTPYSFVATTHSLFWNNINPVFVDIDPIYGNLDPKKIENAITNNTNAIMPVHVYGHPCDVEKITEIAKRYSLKVIYDAAHAFGVSINNKSVFAYGDMSIVSFHATKIFNTFEGGAIISQEKESKEKIDLLKNFGVVDEVTITEPGLNGKMSEFQAALGLLQLKHYEEGLLKRKAIFERYENFFSTIPEFRYLTPMMNCKYNYSYFPVFIKNKENCDVRELFYQGLKKRGIYARKYFFPLISNIQVYKHIKSSDPFNLPNANHFASEVLCLPIFTDMKIEDVDLVFETFKLISQLNS
jgi:dTDP-4-amino-4,6-dideoxy-D-glucose transaminase